VRPHQDLRMGGKEDSRTSDSDLGETQVTRNKSLVCREGGEKARIKNI
jgi:hypothetical protein